MIDFDWKGLGKEWSQLSPEDLGVLLKYLHKQAVAQGMISAFGMIIESLREFGGPEEMVTRVEEIAEEVKSKALAERREIMERTSIKLIEKTRGLPTD